MNRVKVRLLRQGSTQVNVRINKEHQNIGLGGQERGCQSKVSEKYLCELEQLSEPLGLRFHNGYKEWR
jgi:hypothetical protein